MSAKSSAARPRRAIRVEQLAERLQHAASRHGSANRLEIALCATATATLTLGAPKVLHQAFLDRVAAMPELELTATVRGLWKTLVHTSPFLDGHMGPLLDWLDDPRDTDVATFAACLAVLAEVDVRAVAEGPLVGGDLFGPLYTLLRAGVSQQALAAFFTPATVTALMADMVSPEEGGSFVEPCCGTGGMVVAAARSMRSVGKDPSTVAWHLTDLDPMAIALAGVNAAIHGLRDVTLTCGDALAPPR